MSIKQLGGVFGRNPTFNDVTIEGELTFDGDIDINSDLKIDGNLEVTGTSSLTGNTSISRPDNGVVDFNATNTGTTGTSNSRVRAYVSGATGGDPSIGVGITGVQDYYWSIDNSDSDKLKLLANGSSILDFTPAGAATFSDNVIIGTSGKGIDFSATGTGTGTSTSELLDDYEEGTFTPVATFTGGSGTIGYGTQDGSYTKVGNLVTIRIFLVTTSLASRTGNMTITGLPFPSAATYHGVAACGYAAGLAITAGEYLTGYIPPSDSKIQITRFSSSAGASLVTATQWSDDGGAIFTAQYTV